MTTLASNIMYMDNHHSASNMKYIIEVNKCNAYKEQKEVVQCLDNLSAAYDDDMYLSGLILLTIFIIALMIFIFFTRYTLR